MKKRKFKDSIIEDYITILSAINFCDIYLCNFNLNLSEKESLRDLKNFALSLSQTYKKIMFRLGLINLYSAILDKEMLTRFSATKKDFSIDNELFKNKTKEYGENLLKISKNLEKKLQLMDLNTFELNYLHIEQPYKLNKTLS